LKDVIPLTSEQREANLFIRNMLKAKADKANVNPSYFESIYKMLRPNDEYEDGCMLGGVKIIFNEKIKKYYFN